MKHQRYISQEEFERIERYVLDLMAKEERESFEEEISENPDLMEKYREVKSLIGAMEEGVLRYQLDQFHKDIPNEPFEVTQSKLPVWRIVSVAASLALVIALGFLLLQNRQEGDVFNAYYEPDPGLVTAMSSASNYEFDRGMVDYKLGDFDKAADRWTVLVQEGIKNDTLYYFMGSAKLAMGMQKDAIRFFQDVIQLPDGHFTNESYWYLALALVKDGDIDGALQALAKTDHPMKNSLLEKLEDM